MISTFNDDLNKEQKLAVFLDKLYMSYNIFGSDFTYKRINDLTQQHQGIDIIVQPKNNNSIIYVDEKAQLDYIGKNLPTFAFEISYYNKDKKWKQGWFFDGNKVTQQYFLITCIQVDTNGDFSNCRLVYVDRWALISFLKDKRNLGEEQVFEYEKDFRATNKNGKLPIKELNEYNEGYFYYSNSNKIEKPINLILKLGFLIKEGLAKELIPCK